MKNVGYFGRLAAVVAVGGCGLINAKTFSYDYAFDAQQFMAKLADDSVKQTVPTIQCTTSPDNCAMAQSQLPAGAAAQLVCDSASHDCMAVADLHLAYPVDLSQQKLPPDVVQYGASSVTIEKVAYWIVSNTVNVNVPPIDLYVASASAKDEHDVSATKIGSVSGLPMRSSSCVDAADATGDAMAAGARVCDVALTDAGRSALGNFVKNYKTPFQFIAHTTVTAHAGDPLPAGSVDFYMRPTVSFSILK
jgi:hypothetical protein